MRTRAISLVLAGLLLLATGAAAAVPDWSPCLDCHDDDGLTLTTKVGETLPLAVTAAELSGSVHRGVECQACHPGINLDSHPEGNPVASVEQYRAAAVAATAPAPAAAAQAAAAPAKRESVARNVALFFAAPFIGLAYIIAFPFIGVWMVARHGLKSITGKQ